MASFVIKATNVITIKLLIFMFFTNHDGKIKKFYV